MLENLPNLSSVCLFLGPHRNLTGLFGVLLGLHPYCRLVNHQGVGGSNFRLYGEVPEGIVTEESPLPKSLRWMTDYSEEGFDEFVSSLMLISVNGGSIGSCHAFNRGGGGGNSIRKAYVECGDVPKEELKCIVHRDYVLHNLIRTGNIDLDYLLERNDKLRFFMPIRNTLDQALSCWLKKGRNIEAFPQYKGKIQEEVPTNLIVEAIVEEIAWFMSFERRHPDRFFYITEQGFREEKIVELAAFLGLEPEPRWIKNCLECGQVIPKKYKGMIEPIRKESGLNLETFTRDLLLKTFEDDPEFLSELYYGI